MLLSFPFGASLELVIGDITAETTDAIVNAANSSLLGGGGVDGAIHRAGGAAIQQACREIRKTQYPGGLPTGRAVATTGGSLRVKHVIHTVGPIWNGGNRGEPELLASCYREALRAADQLQLRSLSFPSISTGAYGYPMDQAARIALAATLDALQSAQHVRQVRFVLYDQRAYDAHSHAARELQRERPDLRPSVTP